MKVAILALLLLFTFANCDLFANKENGVMVLDDETINNAIQFYDKIVIEFYAPWCSACTRFTPEFEKACEKLQSLDDPIY